MLKSTLRMLLLILSFDVHSDDNSITMKKDVSAKQFLHRNIAIQGTRNGTPHVIIEQNKATTAAKKKRGDLKKGVFSGKPISLNFQKIEVKTVLQLIANFTGINIVVSDQVKGEMTLKLDNIPWDQALAIILKAEGLEQNWDANVLKITPKQRGINAPKGNENEDNLALESLFISLNYAKAKDLALLFNDSNHSLLSKYGSFRADSRTNALWIQDEAKQIAIIKKLIAQLDVPLRQVLIEARIVHLAKESIEDLGLRFDLSRQASSDDRSSSNRFNIDLGLIPTNPVSLGFALAKLGNGILLDLELSALEAEDKAEIIASPRLMTMNQQTATIESGEEIPYQESTASGATNLTFKKAVLSLKVTPQITPDNKLLLELRINQDTPSGKLVNNVPTIFTREIATNVLVNNGQTVVLGGIYKQEKDDALYSVPMFGNLPGWLGAPFRKKHKKVRNEELLIFITPKIMTNA